MELVGSFTTIDFFVGFSLKCGVFDTSVKVFSESTNSFSFPQSSKNTLSHSGNDGTSPVARSCNALWLAKFRDQVGQGVKFSKTGRRHLK